MAKSQVDQYSLNVLKQLNTLPLNDETKVIWVEILETKGLNEFLAKEILDLLPTLPKPEDDHAARLLSKNLMVITQNVRQWRLNQGLQHAKSRR